MKPHIRTAAVISSMFLGACSASVKGSGEARTGTAASVAVTQEPVPTKPAETTAPANTNTEVAAPAPKAPVFFDNPELDNRDISQCPADPTVVIVKTEKGMKVDSTLCPESQEMIEKKQDVVRQIRTETGQIPTDVTAQCFQSKVSAVGKSAKRILINYTVSANIQGEGEVANPETGETRVLPGTITKLYSGLCRADQNKDVCAPLTCIDKNVSEAFNPRYPDAEDRPRYDCGTKKPDPSCTPADIAKEKKRAQEAAKKPAPGQ